VRLRGRFTLWFAVAALVPIAVAAVVTREVVTRSLREDYRSSRAGVETAIRDAVGRRAEDVQRVVNTLTGQRNALVGGILSDLVKNGGLLDGNARRRIREQEEETREGLGLAVLMVTGAGDEVLSAPHNRSAVGDVDPVPAARARATPGQAFFAFDKLMRSSSLETLLVVEAAKTARESGQQVAVLVGFEIGKGLLDPYRRKDKVDARIVDPTGRVLVRPGPAWNRLANHPPIRVELPGADGKPVAWIEVAVADAGLESLLRQVTMVSGALAIAAIAITVLVGLLVARRMTRDLDRLVDGAHAAARGDLDHRVEASSQDEVGEVAAAFNRMMEEVQGAKERLVIAERIAAWQEIARRLAHEIKNPLTPIQMAMDTLRKTWRKQHPSFGEILEESTQSVLEEADRLKRIVSEFSDFARMPKPDIASCDLNDVVTGALGLYQEAAPLERRLAPDLPPIEADRGQLSQVLRNLVENARDAIASRPDGRIVVATRRGDAGDRVEITVEDNGPGVPAELKERVFTPYFTTKHAHGGTGLGLAIVHRIVSDHGGRIGVVDAATGGARFVVELPLRQDAGTGLRSASASMRVKSV